MKLLILKQTSNPDGFEFEAYTSLKQALQSEGIERAYRKVLIHINKEPFVFYNLTFSKIKLNHVKR